MSKLPKQNMTSGSVIIRKGDGKKFTVAFYGHWSDIIAEDGERDSIKWYGPDEYGYVSASKGHTYHPYLPESKPDNTELKPGQELTYEQAMSLQNDAMVAAVFRDSAGKDNHYVTVKEGSRFTDIGRKVHLNIDIADMWFGMQTANYGWHSVRLVSLPESKPEPTIACTCGNTLLIVEVSGEDDSTRILVSPCDRCAEISRAAGWQAGINQANDRTY